MESSQQLLAALAEMGVDPANVALEHDQHNDCLCLVQRDGEYVNPDASPERVMAAFFQQDSPLAKWLLSQIQACVAETV